MEFDLGSILALLNFLFGNPLILGGVIGAFVGWNLPQPAYAKWLQDKAVGLFRKVVKKADK